MTRFGVPIIPMRVAQTVDKLSKASDISLVEIISKDINK